MKNDRPSPAGTARPGRPPSAWASLPLGLLAFGGCLLPALPASAQDPAAPAAAAPPKIDVTAFVDADYEYDCAELAFGKTADKERPCFLRE